MKITRDLLSAAEDPQTFLFKLRNRRIVSFNLCKSLRAFAANERGAGIGHIIDVGANVGQFAKMARYCWPAAQIDSYEPDPTAAARFREIHGHDTRIRLHEHAVGSAAGTLVIRRGETSEQNSVLTEIGRHSTGTFETRVLTLDQAEKSEVAGGCLVKIDVQGYEMQVIAGAGMTLQAATFALIEVSLAPIFEGGARIDEVWSSLRGFGLDYEGVLDQYRDPLTQSIMQMDVLFRRQP